MNIKPMLAYKAGIKPIDFSQQVYIQPKLDGVRCLFTKDGAFSRTGKQFMNVKHIENELQPLFNDYPNLILDGELYNHALKNDFEKIISLVRKQKPNPFDRSEAYEFVEFHWYDIIDDDNDILFIDRSKFIHELLRDFFPDRDARHVFPLVTLRVDSLDKARAIHDANLLETMSKTSTQIKDQLVRKGASEVIEEALKSGVFFSDVDEMHNWIENNFDYNMLGHTDNEYDEVMDIMMEEVHDRVYEFFNQVQQGILEKAFLVQKSLAHDTDL